MSNDKKFFIERKSKRYYDLDVIPAFSVFQSEKDESGRSEILIGIRTADHKKVNFVTIPFAQEKFEIQSVDRDTK